MKAEMIQSLEPQQLGSLEFVRSLPKEQAYMWAIEELLELVIADAWEDEPAKVDAILDAVPLLFVALERMKDDRPFKALRLMVHVIGEPLLETKISLKDCQRWALHQESRGRKGFSPRHLLAAYGCVRTWVGLMGNDRDLTDRLLKILDQTDLASLDPAVSFEHEDPKLLEFIMIYSLTRSLISQDPSDSSATGNLRLRRSGLVVGRGGA